MKTSDRRLTEHRHLLSKCRPQERKSHPQRQEEGINEYIHGNNPRKKVLKVRKYHYLYNVSDPMIWNGHIDESVFALSFQENVVVFNESKDKRQHRSSVFACVYSTPNDTGVGDCFRLFILRFYHNLLEDKRRNGETIEPDRTSLEKSQSAYI